MQTAWIWMRRRVTRRLTQIRAVWHWDNIFTNFERHWSTLKIEADEKFIRRQLIWRLRVKPLPTSCKFAHQQNLWWKQLLHVHFATFERIQESPISIMSQFSALLTHFIEKGHLVNCISKISINHNGSDPLRDKDNWAGWPKGNKCNVKSDWSE